jgi:hypothetical protein
MGEPPVEEEDRLRVQPDRLAEVGYNLLEVLQVETSASADASSPGSRRIAFRSFSNFSKSSDGRILVLDSVEPFQ